MSTKEVIDLAEKVIKDWGITDEDEMQELYLKALSVRGLDREEVNTALQKALKKIMINRKRESVVYVMPVVSVVNRRNIDEIQISLRADCYRNLMKLLELLNDDERKIIEYRYFNDYSIQQVARITYLSENTVLQLERAGLRKLKNSPFLEIVKDYYPVIQ